MAPSVLGETSPSLLRGRDQHQKRKKKKKRSERRGKLPLSESSDKLSLAGELVAVHVALDVPTGKALVVTGDEGVGVVHARSVHGEPVNHADGVATVVLDAEHRHVLVDVVRVLVGLRVVGVRVRRATASNQTTDQNKTKKKKPQIKQSVSDIEKKKRFGC